MLALENLPNRNMADSTTGGASDSVSALLDSLDGEDQAAVSQAWADEIRRRKQELRSGATRAVSWQQAKARLSAL